MSWQDIDGVENSEHVANIVESSVLANSEDSKDSSGLKDDATAKVQVGKKVGLILTDYNTLYLRHDRGAKCATKILKKANALRLKTQNRSCNVFFPA